MTKFTVRTVKVSDDELRESLLGGWNQELPAIKDENGVVLVGNRRLRIAEQEGISPVIKIVTFGAGSDADAARIRLANVSNIGGAPLTAEDRKRQAERLYQNGLTMEAIAHMLGVAKSTVSLDLSCSTSNNSERKSKRGRKNEGRPKGKKSTAPRARPGRGRTDTSAQVNDVQERALASAVIDGGKSLEEASAEFGLASDMVARFAVAREQGRREAISDPQIQKTILAMTAQQKLDAAMRQHKRNLEIEFELRCRDECRRWLNDVSLPQYAKEIAALEHSIRERRGVMDRITYRKILACLHPDRVDVVLKKRYEEAFRLFTELEKRLLNEKESPTPFRQMPRTLSELMAMRAKVQAERKAKRAAH